MFGKLISKIVATPLRIAATPVRVLNALMDEPVKENFIDEIGNTVEEIVEKVVDGE